MRSIDIANLFIHRHGNELNLTNITLNKLVYFAQVETLRVRPGHPLFTDEIQAWQYGPVEPIVYHAFKDNGNMPVTVPSDDVSFSGEDPRFVISIIDMVAEKYGRLTPFDLVSISHRDGGAWKKKFTGAYNVPITVEDIELSADYTSPFNPKETFGAAIQSVQDKWPNALRMLEDA